MKVASEGMKHAGEVGACKQGECASSESPPGQRRGACSTSARPRPTSRRCQTRAPHSCARTAQPLHLPSPHSLRHGTCPSLVAGSRTRRTQLVAKGRRSEISVSESSLVASRYVSMSSMPTSSTPGYTPYISPMAYSFTFKVVGGLDRRTGSRTPPLRSLVSSPSPTVFSLLAPIRRFVHPLVSPANGPSDNACSLPHLAKTCGAFPSNSFDSGALLDALPFVTWV